MWVLKMLWGEKRQLTETCDLKQAAHLCIVSDFEIAICEEEALRDTFCN